MHLPILLLLSASLASAQFGNQFIPSPAGLKYPKPINRHPHYVQNTNKEIDNYDNYDYDDYDYDNIPSLPTPTPSPSPTPRIHSTFLVRPSQTPTVHAPAHGYGHAYNHPSSGSDAESRDNAPSFRGADDNDNDVSPGASGGVAPINPLAPGSQVAPAPLFVNANYGKDEGNAFCSGRCFEDEGDAQCAKPYALAIYKPAKGCYMCCITSDF